MQRTLLITTCILLLIAIIHIIFFRSKSRNQLPQLHTKVSELQSSLSKIDINLKEDFRKTLDEKLGALITKIDVNNKPNRKELTQIFTHFSGANIIQLEKINNQAKENNRLIRKAIVNAFKDFQEAFDENIKSFNDLQRETFGQMDNKQNKLVKNTENKLESITMTRSIQK